MAKHPPAMKHVCSSRTMQRRSGKHGQETHELNNITESPVWTTQVCLTISCICPGAPKTSTFATCVSHVGPTVTRVAMFQPKKFRITTVLTIPNPQAPRHSISPRGSDVREVRRWNRVAWTMRPRGSSYEATQRRSKTFHVSNSKICYIGNGYLNPFI